MLDLDSICSSLSDHFPTWSGWIKNLQLEDAVGIRPVDNDGRTIFYNSRLMRYYTPETQTFYIAQQMIHLRLSHFARGREKNPRVWKRATDSIVNRMLRDDGFPIPEDAILLQDSEDHCAEEVYEILLATMDPNAEHETENENLESERRPSEKKSSSAGKKTEGGKREIDDPGLAAAVRGLSEMLEPSMQLDYDWFPGDTIRDGVLPWRFRAYPVSHAEILLDTSASVDTDLLRAFVKGVKALMKEDAVVRVGCFDTRFYGFHDIHTEKDIDSLELRGAGGTNFEVAINAFSGDAENKIIFTDGYAEMPEQRCDAIWVVYGTSPVHPFGGRVIYAKPPQEKEKHEIDFLIT